MPATYTLACWYFPKKLKIQHFSHAEILHKSTFIKVEYISQEIDLSLSAREISKDPQSFSCGIKKYASYYVCYPIFYFSFSYYFLHPTFIFLLVLQEREGEKTRNNFFSSFQ